MKNGLNTLNADTRFVIYATILIRIDYHYGSHKYWLLLPCGLNNQQANIQMKSKFKIQGNLQLKSKPLVPLLFALNQTISDVLLLKRWTIDIKERLRHLLAGI